MGQAPNWTSDEKARLCEEWGKYSLPTMAKRFNRSIEGITIMRQRLGLPDLIASSEYITLNALIQELGLNYGYDVPRLKRMGLPIKHQTIIEKRVAMVDIESFWGFAEKNAHFFDFSRLSEFALGPEPEWVKIKRRSDKQRRGMIKPHNIEWTTSEDDHLLMLVRQQRYSYMELSRILHRSEGAIQRRLQDLGIPDRPLKADNTVKWTDDELKLLTDGIKKGENYETLSLNIGKSAKAIRGKVYSCYLSESLDKARRLMGEGSFGDGRPERQLKHKNVMDREERQITKDSLSYLCGILKKRMKQLSGVGDEFADFWQKDMCQHWDGVQGCTKCEENCDVCTSFERIKPQACKRCGGTFYMRETSLYCQRCIEDRRKAHKKKVAYMLSHGKW